MSLFGNILEKLNLKKPAAAPAKPAATAAPKVGMAKMAGETATAAPAAAKPAAIAVVDVVSKLEAMAKSKPGLDWKVSIVDLLKLLDLDSSFDARKGMAVELGCPEKLMGDSAAMNTWLHKTVLQKIAENGGNIPASLLK
ncbi:MAG: hypothetical protein FD146_2107 [Anaerolineaceae bacterium]|nr:MAG: hypothetical protein FD146_2107 [Anaerolineaceae bacterium]